MPTIGDEVLIGVNFAIVDKVSNGDDVLIAPNAFVNCNIPSHSVALVIPVLLSSEIMRLKDI